MSVLSWYYTRILLDSTHIRIFTFWLTKVLLSSVKTTGLYGLMWDNIKSICKHAVYNSTAHTQHRWQVAPIKKKSVVLQWCNLRFITSKAKPLNIQCRCHPNRDSKILSRIWNSVWAVHILHDLSCIYSYYSDAHVRKLASL